MFGKRIIDKIFNEAIKASKTLNEEYETMRVKNVTRIVETHQMMNQKLNEFQKHKEETETAFRFIRNK
ncbi:hypothetical protein LG52_3890 [Geobacillus kaustophilus]|uniref:Uncharacterized protein n=1 Tax=Geobacillus kaustophilus TaxID=1462 RepID=A0A0D8C712_GEOKU|nr:hypothetical protein [Geobacillus kaustophilus]KJE26572.1 hypothetical protein LG52_2658 [Geobacillus kaustophilus]KJE32223.1 hypothetical protein LG52_3890 [Geobacillus kaustophilus]MCG5026979.1 hypothetical protein [Anoxybacillus flavithermus]